MASEGPQEQLTELIREAQQRPGVSELMMLYVGRRAMIDLSDRYLSHSSGKPRFAVSSDTQ